MSGRTWVAVAFSLAVVAGAAVYVLVGTPRANPVARVAALPTPQPAEVPPPPVVNVSLSPAVEAIRRDLKLEFEPYTTDVQAGFQVGAKKLELVNRSKTDGYRVVKSGDGSDRGWRQPHVYFTAERRTTDGKWETEALQRGGRCKEYDWDWPRDVITLAPGEALPLDWVYLHSEFQHPGTVRVTAHYAYSPRSGAGNSEILPVEKRGGMGECPEFTVSSEPMELTVTRPLDVKARAKRKLKMGEAVNLSDVIEATVTNTTANPIELTELGSNMSCGSNLTVVSDGFEQVKLDGYRQVYGQKMPLAAGKTVGLFGSGDFTNGADAKVIPQKSGTHRVVVIYSPQVNNGGSMGPQLTAETEIVVEP